MTGRNRPPRNRVHHFWDGSHIACGQPGAYFSTEAPSLVSCRRCLPAARAAERRWNAFDDARAVAP